MQALLKEPLFATWPQVVGPEIGLHTTPLINAGWSSISSVLFYCLGDPTQPCGAISA